MGGLTKRILITSCAASALFAGGAVAQTEDQSGAALVYDEIVVSAQKRDELARDVPITLSAVSGDFIESVGIDAFDELSDFVPGLTVQLQSPNNPGFVIRGITSDSGDFQQAPRVSVYLNGVDVSRSRGSAFELFDLERVEVIKGPQATLFGTAAAIGAVSVHTARPQQEFEAQGYAAYGNYDYLKLGGYVTGGNEHMQGRIAFQYRERDGYVDNIAGDPGSQSAGSQPEDDLNGLGTFAARGSVRFTPNSDFTLDVIVNHEENDQPGTAFKSGVIAPTGGDTSPFTFAELNTGVENFEGTPIAGAGAVHLGGDELGLERTLTDVNITAEWRVNDTLTVTSVTGFREFESLEIFDADGSQVPLAQLSEDTEGEQWSTELRVNFDTGDRWRGFAGLNFFHEEGFQRAPILLDETIFFNCIDINPDGTLSITQTCVNPDGSFNRINLAPQNPPFDLLIPADQGMSVPNFSEFTNSAENDVFSAFVDVSFDVTPDLTATAGMRYISEERFSGISTIFPDSALLPVLTNGQQFGPVLQGFASTDGAILSDSGDFDAVLPRFNVLWRATDAVNLYATVSKGRRSPVIEITEASAGLPNPVNLLPAETIWNYEAGLKGLFLGGAARGELAVFHQQYENFQVQVLLPGAGISTTQTTGKASNTGVEGSLEVQANDYIFVFGNFAWIDAKIEDDPENGIFAGNRFRLQPEWSGAFGVSGSYPVGDLGEAFATLTYSYRSDVFFEAANQPIAGIPIREEDVHLVNLRVGLAEAGDRWQVTLFADNLFDEEYVIDAGNTGGSFGTPTFIAGPPAMYGVELKTAF